MLDARLEKFPWQKINSNLAPLIPGPARNLLVIFVVGGVQDCPRLKSQLIRGNYPVSHRRIAPTFRRNKMDFVHRFAAVTLGTLLMVFSVAFVSIPYSLSGHPGDGLASADTSYHLS